MKRAALSLATTIGALLALTPTSALAEGETILSYSGDPMAGSSITVTAAPGRANTLGYEPFDQGGAIAGQSFQDTSAGLIESPDTPYCNQFSSTEVRCMNEGLNSLSISTGDRRDTLRMYDTIVIGSGFGGAVLVNTGSGPDTVNAFIKGDVTATFNSGSVELHLQQGNDTANVSGRARASGGPGKDKLRGRRGNQRLFGNANADRIGCGKGNKDLGNGGGGDDTIADNCERVVNP